MELQTINWCARQQVFKPFSYIRLAHKKRNQLVGVGFYVMIYLLHEVVFLRSPMTNTNIGSPVGSVTSGELTIQKQQQIVLSRKKKNELPQEAQSTL